MSIVEDMGGLPGPEADVKDPTHHQHQGEGKQIAYPGGHEFAVPLPPA